MSVIVPMPRVTLLWLGPAAWTDHIVLHNDAVRQYQQAIPSQRAYRQRPSNYHIAAVTICSVFVERSFAGSYAAHSEMLLTEKGRRKGTESEQCDNEAFSILKKTQATRRGLWQRQPLHISLHGSSATDWHGQRHDDSHELRALYSVWYAKAPVRHRWWQWDWEKSLSALYLTFRVSKTTNRLLSTDAIYNGPVHVCLHFLEI